MSHLKIITLLKRDGPGLLAGLIAVVVPLVVLAAPRSDSVAVIGSPNADAADMARIVATAGGTILGVGARPNILIARADSDGFAGRLYAAGARLILDGDRARLCGRASQGAATAQSIAKTRISAR